MSMNPSIDLLGLILPPAQLMHGTERQPISHWRAMGRRCRCLQIKPGNVFLAPWGDQNSRDGTRTSVRL